MRRLGSVFLLFAMVASARHDAAGCGTTRETPAETLFLHRQSVRARLARRAAQAAAPAPNDRDIGNIAIIEDSGGVVEALNQFNLDGSTLTFTPAASDASRYRYAVSAASYDSTAAVQGAPVVGLGDDDSREIALPFPFRFFGATYQKLWINSDGNLTFVAAENASSSRLTGRVTGGPPRVAPLFDDLDPSQVPGGGADLADAFEPELCLSEDGARLAVVLDDRVEVLDATRALEPIKTHGLTGVDDVAFLHGHRRLLITAREGTSLIDPDTGERSALPRGGPALSWHWTAPRGGPTFAVTREAVPRLVRWDDDGAGGCVKRHPCQCPGRHGPSP